MNAPFAGPTVPLGDLVTITSGFAFKSERFAGTGELPVIRIRDVKRGYSKTFYLGDYDDAFLVGDGDLLIGMDGEFNRERWQGGKALLNQRVCKLIANEHKLSKNYLYHFLPQALKEIEDRTPFATVKHLSSKDIRGIQIPLPPLEEQRRIAAILDKADALRRKRKRTLKLLDSLTKSIFLEMFGDPAMNSRKYPLMTFGEISEKMSDGPFGSNLKSEHYVPNGIRVIRLQNIGVGKFIDGDKAFISANHFRSLAKHECRPGDILVGTLGDPNLRACLQPEWMTVALNKADCVQIRPNPDIAIPAYVAALINQPSVEKLAHGLMLGQTRTRISMGRLRELRVPVAPLSEQQRFVAAVQATSRIEEAANITSRTIDSLFSSLQSRAFSGQL